MLEMLIQNAVNSIDELKELYCVDKLESFDVVANCKPNVKAIARVSLIGDLITEIIYLRVVGINFDDDFNEIEEDDEEEDFDVTIITKNDFDGLVTNACKWFYEIYE